MSSTGQHAGVVIPHAVSESGLRKDEKRNSLEFISEGRKDKVLKNFARILALSLSIMGGFFLLYRLRERSDPASQETEVGFLQEGHSQTVAHVGGPFTLIDQDQRVRHDKEFRGKIMMVYFGYSFCPDICPTGLASMTQALAALKPHQAHRIAPIFITVDPERDTPAEMKEYMKNFDPRFLALTGTSDQLDPVLKSYHVYAARATPEGTAADYLVDHSSIIYIMDRKGRFVGHANHAVEPQQLVAILQKALAS